MSSGKRRIIGFYEHLQPDVTRLRKENCTHDLMQFFDPGFASDATLTYVNELVSEAGPLVDFQ